MHSLALSQNLRFVNWFKNSLGQRNSVAVVRVNVNRNLNTTLYFSLPTMQTNLWMPNELFFLFLRFLNSLNKITSNISIQNSITVDISGCFYSHMYQKPHRKLRKRFWHTTCKVLWKERSTYANKILSVV